MNKIRLFIVLSLSFIAVACGILPLERQISDGHLIIQNYKKVKTDPSEFIYLACNRQRPDDWRESRVIKAGNHQLWVKAVFEKGGNGYVMFDVNLEAGKRYSLSRKIVDKNVSVWIEEEQSKKIVSEVLDVDLKIPLVTDDKVKIEQCKSGTV